MKILALGDVVGQNGLLYLQKNLRKFKKDNNIDFTVINCENAAQFNGIDKNTALDLLESGADVLTSGNHVFRISAVYSFLDESKYIIRPANFSGECPGHGYTIINNGTYRILIMNVLGNVYMDSVNSPFEAIQKILVKEKGNYDLSILDIHAEATSEKIAIARYFDGKIDIVFGTHTHVQTNDLRILNKGTAFITDLGMCGPDDSILGVISERVIDKLRLNLPRKFEYADGPCSASGAIFEYNNGKITNLSLVKF